MIPSNVTGRPPGPRGSHRLLRPLLACALGVGTLGFPVPVQVGDAQIPWECSNYTGDAQTRCMQALIETQREQIGKLEGELKAQQGAVGHLREQVDRQSAATAELQRQLANQPAAVQTAPQVYIAPPGVGLYPGFGLYLERPWGYGYGAYFGYRPYFGYGYSHFRRCRGPWRGCW